MKEQMLKITKFGCLGYIGIMLIGLIFSYFSDMADTRTQKKIENAITANDFATARQLLKDIESPDEYKEKVNRSEITYLYKMGELERASRVAIENESVNIYQELVADEIPKLLADKDFEKVFNILSTWSFFEDPIYSEDDCDASKINQLNAKYNSEIGTYNDLVFKLFNAALANNNRVYVNKSMVLFQDEIVVKIKKLHEGSKDRWDVTFDKESKALQEAKRKKAQYYR